MHTKEYFQTTAIILLLLLGHNPIFVYKLHSTSFRSLIEKRYCFIEQTDYRIATQNMLLL